jgi:hypothetical protein
MPATRHVERHFTSGDTVRDIVIGMSHGLTVPFALAAGLSGAVESPRWRLRQASRRLPQGRIAMGLAGISRPGAMRGARLVQSALQTSSPATARHPREG